MQGALGVGRGGGLGRALGQWRAVVPPLRLAGGRLVVVVVLVVGAVAARIRSRTRGLQGRPGKSVEHVILVPDVLCLSACSLGLLCCLHSRKVVFPSALFRVLARRRQASTGNGSIGAGQFHTRGHVSRRRKRIEPRYR